MIDGGLEGQGKVAYVVLWQHLILAERSQHDQGPVQLHGQHGQGHKMLVIAPLQQRSARGSMGDIPDSLSGSLDTVIYVLLLNRCRPTCVVQQENDMTLSVHFESWGPFPESAKIKMLSPIVRSSLSRRLLRQLGQIGKPRLSPARHAQALPIFARYYTSETPSEAPDAEEEDDLEISLSQETLEKWSQMTDKVLSQYTSRNQRLILVPAKKTI